MKGKTSELRAILSFNLKRHREKLGFSQEKLAYDAEISTMMVKDIEGCRTWVSDKTLAKLAFALDTDVYRLLIPGFALEEEIFRAVHNDLEVMSQKILSDIEANLKTTIGLWKDTP